MRCVILQPSYIPWRGYFDQIARADLFVFYDDVQYDARGWRNRNRIKTPQGPRWLTIPVHKHGAQTEKIPIQDIRIAWDREWTADHWRTLEMAYRPAPYFEHHAPWLQAFYTRRPEKLADFTVDLTIAIARELGLRTEFLRASSLQASGSKTDRLLDILKKLGADRYLSGPSAQAYIEAEKFDRAGIQLEFMRYDYPEYPQLYPPYDSQVSILDLLFMAGPQAMDFIQGEGKVEAAGRKASE